MVARRTHLALRYRSAYSASLYNPLCTPPRLKPDPTSSEGLVCTNVNMLPSGAMNTSICEPSLKVTVPVQSALTVYVRESGSLRVTSPLKLEESTPFALPLPSKTAYPAKAKGTCSSLLLISTPLKANRYVP